MTTTAPARGTGHEFVEGLMGILRGMAAPHRECFTAAVDLVESLSSQDVRETPDHLRMVSWADTAMRCAHWYYHKFLLRHLAPPVVTLQPWHSAGWAVTLVLPGMGRTAVELTCVTTQKYWHQAAMGGRVNGVVLECPQGWPALAREVADRGLLTPDQFAVLVRYLRPLALPHEGWHDHWVAVTLALPACLWRTATTIQVLAALAPACRDYKAAAAAMRHALHRGWSLGSDARWVELEVLCNVLLPIPPVVAALLLAAGLCPTSLHRAYLPGDTLWELGLLGGAWPCPAARIVLETRGRRTSTCPGVWPLWPDPTSPTILFNLPSQGRRVAWAAGP